MSRGAKASAQYEITMRLECPHEPGGIARITALIGEGGGLIRAIDLVRIHRGRSIRDYTIECPSIESGEEIVEALPQPEARCCLGVQMEDLVHDLPLPVDLQQCEQVGVSKSSSVTA